MEFAVSSLELTEQPNNRTTDNYSKAISDADGEGRGIRRIHTASGNATPAQVVEHHEIDEAAIIGILTIAPSDENAVEPFRGNGLTLIAGHAIHDLVLDMQEQASEDLDIGIGRHAKIMPERTAYVLVEITIQIVDATNADFPWAEDTVAYLRRNRQRQTAAIETEAEIATIDHPSTHVLPIGRGLRRSIATKAQ